MRRRPRKPTRRSSAARPGATAPRRAPIPPESAPPAASTRPRRWRTRPGSSGRSMAGENRVFGVWGRPILPQCPLLPWMADWTRSTVKGPRSSVASSMRRPTDDLLPPGCDPAVGCPPMAYEMVATRPEPRVMSSLDPAATPVGPLSWDDAGPVATGVCPLRSGRSWPECGPNVTQGSQLPWAG